MTLPLTCELPSVLTLDKLPSELRRFEDEFSRKLKQSSVFVWFALVFGIGDALLVANRQPSFSTLLFKMIQGGIKDSYPKFLPQFNVYGSFIIVVLIQFFFLWIAWSSLHQTPWGIWMGIGLRKTALLSNMRSLLSPSFLRDIRESAHRYQANIAGLKDDIQLEESWTEEFWSRHRSELIACLLVFVQIILWLKFLFSLNNLLSSLPEVIFLPEWIIQLGFVTLAFIMSWVVITAISNLFRDRTALFGIAFGLAAVIAGSVYGQAYDEGLFSPDTSGVLEGIRWWSVGIVIFNFLILGTLSSDNLSSGRVRLLQIDPSASNRLHTRINISDPSSSILPRLKFKIEAPEQRILVLRRNRFNDYVFHDPESVILPTEHTYEILNLSSLGKQEKLLNVKVDAPDQSFRLTLSLFVRSVTSSALPKEFQKLVLDSPPVNRIIESFFQRGQGEIVALQSIMFEVVKIWLGEDSVKVSKLMTHCDNLIRSIELGTPLPDIQGQIDGRTDVVNLELKKLAGVDNEVQLAKQITIQKRRDIGTIQAELIVIENELRSYERQLFNLREPLKEKFQEFVIDGIVRIYPEEYRERYKATINILLGIINLELVTVSHEELPRLKELRKKIELTKEQLIKVNKMNPSLEAALKNRDEKVYIIVREAIENQMPLQVLGQEVLRALLGSQSPSALPSELDRSMLEDDGYKSEF